VQTARQEVVVVPVASETTPIPPIAQTTSATVPAPIAASPSRFITSTSNTPRPGAGTTPPARGSTTSSVDASGSAFADASTADDSSHGVSGAVIAVPITLILLAILAAGFFYGRKYFRTKQERRHTVLVDQAFNNDKPARTMSEAWDGAGPHGPSMISEKRGGYEDEDTTAYTNVAGFGVAIPPVSPLSPRYGTDPFGRHPPPEVSEYLASPPAVSTEGTFETARSTATVRPDDAQVDSLYGGCESEIGIAALPASAGAGRQSMGNFSTYSKDSWADHQHHGRSPSGGFLSVDEARDSVLDAYGRYTPPHGPGAQQQLAAPGIVVSPPSEADEGSLHARTRPASIVTVGQEGARKSLRWSSYMPWAGK
jgi:hypothetical protein